MSGRFCYKNLFSILSQGRIIAEPMTVQEIISPIAMVSA
jgi:hypothetical protein